MLGLPASTGSKWISTSPLYPGDLFHNMGCYWPVPDYTQPYWEMAHAAAEKYAYGSANARAAYRKVAMFYDAASSGPDLIPLIMAYPDRVIEHARRFTTDSDVPYLTARRATDVLDPELMQSVFATNYRRNVTASAVAAQAMRDTYIVGPAHREQMLRALQSKHSILRGISFEDAIFEMHLWGPFCLLEATRGIYGNTAAWSFNAPIEKALGHAIQYGSVTPLMLRHGTNFDVTDIWNRPVPVVDQAWEDARGLVDVVGSKVKLFTGEGVSFRFETAVALLLSRFMHDEFYRSGNRELEAGRAHDIVKKHYASEDDQQRFAHLKELMLPYMAEFCDWPTLHRILDKDPSLKAYWDEYVVPARSRLKPEADIESAILGYLPRGGYDSTSLRRKVEERRDPPRRLQFALQTLPQMAHGQHLDPFDRHFDPKLFNDRSFARLGGTSSPQDDPDPDHYTRGQAAAVMTIAELLHAGLPPADAPRTVLYLDDAASGVRSADFAAKNRIDQQAEQAAIFDPLADGGHSFAEDVAAENQADFMDRVQALALGPNYADWRNDFRIGNVVPASDVRRSLDMYTGYREGTKTMFHKALVTEGPLKLGGDVEAAITRRWIGLELNGLVLVPGEVSDRACRYIAEGVLAATGLTPRTHEGGRYQFEFFMDDDVHLPPQRREAPRKLDLADLMIHVGSRAKRVLDAPHPAKNRDLLVTTARLMQIYEMLIDPAHCNMRTERDGRSGKDTKFSIINWNQVDPSFVDFALHQPGMPVFALSDASTRGERADYEAFVADPDYQAFANDRLNTAEWLDDPGKKAKLAYMTWFYMRAAVIETPKMDIPVTGNLLVKGAHAFDRDDTVNLPDDYQKARSWWHNISAIERANILGQHKTLRVHGPNVAVP